MANIKDVASLTGLSVTTVSRVLNNRGYISNETRQKVFDAMKNINYQPNELARSLFRKHTNILGVIIPSNDQPFFSKLLQSIELYASTIGYKILLCNSYHDRQKEIEYISMLKSNKVDGIIMGSRSTDITDYLDFDFPFVTIDRILDENTPCVSCDNYQGGVLATQFLIDKGCKHLAHISGSPNLNLMANKRDEAFEDICKKKGIDGIMIATDENQFSSMEYHKHIEQLFFDHTNIDGVFASSDVIAAQVIQIAIKKGLRVPEDIKVVGYDDVNISQLTTPAITTIHQPIEQIGKYAVDIIVNQLKGEVVPMRTVLPVKIVEREST
jgi:LacI family sucrose operon transcriptional repressor